MVEVTLRIYSLEDVREIPLTSNRLSIGRDDNVDLPINDAGLSRLHATIHREGDRVWVLDEASTNGTCVNNQPVSHSGLPLADGDEITIGDNTSILIHIREAVNPVLAMAGVAPKNAEARSWTFPLIVAATGIVLVLFTAVIIGSYVTRGKTSSNETQRLPPYQKVENSNGKPVVEPARNSGGTPNPDPTPLPNIADPDGQAIEGSGNLPSRSYVGFKTYASMAKEEQTSFVAQEAQHVARMIGNREGFAFPPEVVRQIKIYVDAYARRRLNGQPPTGRCNMRHDLRTLLTRAGHHAPLVIKSFNEKGLSPQVGLYLAMIESEYCPCLSSGTGAKGMFQFVGTTARLYLVPDVSKPSTDPREDDRCKVEIMAPIAAQYMKDLVAMFGTGPVSVPLAVASYNSGEGGLSGNLRKALNSVSGSERSFWSLVADSSQLSPQFQKENIRYVPKFFGAAIVGENPRVFGVDMEPLSTHTVSQNTAGDSEQ